MPSEPLPNVTKKKKKKKKNGGSQGEKSPPKKWNFLIKKISGKNY